MDLISVIIPFYNAEKYLENALNSILKQSYTNIEVVLVNDGSTDKSIVIAKKCIKNHTNFNLISIKNSGPGIARTIGIKHVKGKYIVFLDADDTYKKDALESMHHTIVKNKTDLCVAMHKMVNSDNKIITAKKYNSESILTNEKAIGLFLKNELIPTSWAKLYKTSIVKKCIFPNIYWKEDDIFIVQYLKKCKKISVLNKVVLINNCYSNSLTRQIISKKMVLDITKSYTILHKYISNDKQKKYLLESQLNTFINLFLILKCDWHKIDNINIYSSIKNGLKELKHKTKNLLSLKKQLVLHFLIASKFIGINPIFFILSIFKRKQLNKLKQIRK